jgi:integrase/recombinase XerD
MDQHLDQFLHYLVVERGLSQNTIEAYSHGLIRFFNYLTEKKIQEIRDVVKCDAQGFLLALRKKRLNTKSIVRNLAALRTFFRFLIQEGILQANPVEDLESPKVAKTLPEILTVKEIERILEQPDLKTPLGIRDRAMVEILYATGMRVSELTHLPTHQVNLEGGYVLLYGKGSKERIVPLGSEAMRWVALYLKPLPFYQPLGEGNEPTAVLEES